MLNPQLCQCGRVRKHQLIWEILSFTICEWIRQKGPLVAMHKVSLQTKMCNRVMFWVNSFFWVFRTCGIVPTPWPSLKLVVLSCASNQEELLRHHHVYGYNNGRVMGRFLIIAPGVFLYFERAYLGNGSSYWSKTKCNEELIYCVSTQYH